MKQHYISVMPFLDQFAIFYFCQSSIFMWFDFLFFVVVVRLVRVNGFDCLIFFSPGAVCLSVKLLSHF